MAEPPSAPLTVRIRFQKVDLEFSACAESTVSDLRAYLHQHTNVAPSKQKLVGLPPAVADDALLTSVKLKPRLMLIGTPDAVLEAAASEHTEAIKAQAAIADDLDLDIELATPAHTNELYLAKVERRVREYKPRMLGEARTGSKLLVLDVDYTLFDHRSPAESAAELGRPFLHEFLSLAYEHNFDIIIWSATSMSWIELKMRDLGLASSAHFSFYAYYDHGAMITLQDDKYGVLDVKPLGSVWGQHSQWGPHNTIMFDDLSRNFLMNPQSGLRIRPCRNMTIAANRARDRELLRLGRYLRLISRVEDFRTLDHKRWERYVKENRPPKRAREVGTHHDSHVDENNDSE